MYNLKKKFESDDSNLRQQRAGKVSGSKMKQLEEHFVTNWVKWQQVSKMMGYKKNK